MMEWHWPETALKQGEEFVVEGVLFRSEKPPPSPELNHGSSKSRDAELRKEIGRPGGKHWSTVTAARSDNKRVFVFDIFYGSCSDMWSAHLGGAMEYMFGGQCYPPRLLILAVMLLPYTMDYGVVPMEVSE
jgi:general stress protein YciG